MSSRRTSFSLPATLAATAVTLGTPVLARAADLTAEQTRGAALFATNCVVCHGAGGKGDGRAASVQKTPPADLTSSRRSAAYKLQIVRYGGAFMKRSDSMPAWGQTLSEQQLADLISYLQVISARATAVAAEESAAATSEDSRPTKEAGQ